MATAIATLPVHWTHAWALLGEWANHITFPLPKASPDGKIVWPRHGSADLLGQTFQTRSPPFVMWAFPAFQQGTLSPLVFLPATFPIRVLPGDKLFQSRVVREDLTLAPVTHAFGGSKLRVGDMLKKAGGSPLPLVAGVPRSWEQTAIMGVRWWIWFHQRDTTYECHAQAPGPCNQ